MTDPTTPPFLPFGKKTASHVRDADWLKRDLERRRRGYAADFIYLALAVAVGVVGTLAVIADLSDLAPLRIFWGIE